MRAEHDPLTLHIFIARREYRNIKDTKSGKRRSMSALTLIAGTVSQDCYGSAPAFQLDVDGGGVVGLISFNEPVV